MAANPSPPFLQEEELEPQTSSSGKALKVRDLLSDTRRDLLQSRHSYTSLDEGPSFHPKEDPLTDQFDWPSYTVAR